MKALRNVRLCALCLLGGLAVLGCHDMAGQTNVGSGKQTRSMEKSWSLTSTRTNIAQKIGPELAEPQKQKFVQIELVSIVNPRKEPLLFEVYFQPENGDRSLLGTFSPYPPDNPGKFIVPTKGRLETGGSVVLSMILPGSTASKDSVKVEVKRLTYRER
jgi:hypothetical protein